MIKLLGKLIGRSATEMDLINVALHVRDELRVRAIDGSYAAISQSRVMRRPKMSSQVPRRLEVVCSEDVENDRCTCLRALGRLRLAELADASPRRFRDALAA